MELFFSFCLERQKSFLSKWCLEQPNMSTCSLPSKNSSKGCKMELSNKNNMFWLVHLMPLQQAKALQNWSCMPVHGASLEHHGSLFCYFSNTIFLIGSQHIIKHNRDEHQKCVSSWSWRITKNNDLSIQLLSSFLNFFLPKKKRKGKEGCLQQKVMDKTLVEKIRNISPEIASI